LAIFYNTTFVVGLSLAVFIGILLYFRVHTLITRALDARAERIRGELDEALRLREEAQATFAEFERKQKEVAAQAEDIIEHAKAEAEQSAERAKADLKASIERRLKAADEQIAMAEANAVKEVRDRAIEVAVAAAGRVMRERITDDKLDALLDEGIAEAGKRLN